MIKALLFDFDGVLFDSEPLHLQACNMIFQDFGFTIPSEIYFKKYVGIADIEIFPLIFKDQELAISVAEVRAFIANKIQAFRAIIDNTQSVKAIEGVPQILEFFATHLRFGICTGANLAEIQPVLSKL